MMLAMMPHLPDVDLDCAIDCLCLLLGFKGDSYPVQGNPPVMRSIDRLLEVRYASAS
jgi:hypothetical protein